MRVHWAMCPASKVKDPEALQLKGYFSELERIPGDYSQRYTIAAHVVRAAARNSTLPVRTFLSRSLP